MIESTQFFLGTVNFKTATLKTTTFEVVGSNAVISVRNDIHLRFNKSFFSSSNFQILAPVTAVEILEGEIPESALVDFALNQYLQLRDNKSLRKKFANEIINKI